MSLSVTRRRTRRLLAREVALVAALAAALIAACSSGSAPPGSTWRRARLPAHVPAPARLRDLEQLLVRGPLLVRHLQLPLLPACRACRDQAARRALDRDRGACVQRSSCSRQWGPSRALVEPHVRRPLAGHRALGRVPVRARGSFALLALCRAAARGGAPGSRCCVLLTLRGEPARVRAPRAGARRRARSAAEAVARRAPRLADRSQRRAAELVLLPAVRRAGALPVQRPPSRPGAALRRRSGSPSRVACPGARLLFGLFWTYLAACIVAFIVPTAVGCERRAPQLHRAPARLARRRRCARGAAVARRSRSLLAGFWNIYADRRDTARARAPTRRTPPSYWQPAIDVPARAPEPVVPRRGRRHRSSTGRPRTYPTRDPDRARLVPAERLPAERAPVRPPPGGARVPGRGCGARRALRRSSPTHRPTTARGGEAALIRSGRSGLDAGVHERRTSTVYRAAEPAAPRHRSRATRTSSGCGPSASSARSSTHRHLPRPLRWSPYWQTTPGLRLARRGRA